MKILSEIICSLTTQRSLISRSFETFEFLLQSHDHPVQFLIFAMPVLKLFETCELLVAVFFFFLKNIVNHYSVDDVCVLFSKSVTFNECC